MAVLDIRQRTGYLFLAVMLGHVILISAQINTRRGVPFLQVVTFGTFAEVQRASSAMVSTLHGGWTNYVSLRDVHAENEALKAQLAESQVQLQEQRALAERSRGLLATLGLRDRSNLKTLAADVIGAGATTDFKTVTIDRGTADGVRQDMAVMAPAGVVGRIVVPSARAAKVQLLVDRNAAAGVLIERSRSQGVAVGAGDELLRMEYVSEVADVVVGDMVVTSGIDGIYPKGYVVGRVEAVEKSGNSYKQILVRPAVDFSSVEEVLVVLTPTPTRPRRGGEQPLKAAGVVIATAIAVALQTTLAQFVVRGAVAVDFVVVAVIYISLTSGPATGLMAGTFAGLVQDALASGEVIGIGGLAMSIVGFLAGIIGTQFIVTQPLPRFVVFFGATVLYKTVYIGLYELLGLRDFGLPVAAVAGQALGNAIVGVVAFQVVELLPGAMERRRAMRGRLRR